MGPQPQRWGWCGWVLALLSSCSYPVALWSSSPAPNLGPLAWPVLELGCATTHTGAKCATWGSDAGAPANASCAAYAGEPLGWCWTDDAHTRWEFCDQACREGSPVKQFNIRDPTKFPSLHEAAGHLHRRGADVDAAIKVLSSAVASARTDVQEYWESGGDVGSRHARSAPAGPTANGSRLADAASVAQAANRRSNVVQSAHSGFLLATLMMVRPVPTTHTHARHGATRAMLAEPGSKLTRSRLGRDRRSTMRRTRCCVAAVPSSRTFTVVSPCCPTAPNSPL